MDHDTIRVTFDDVAGIDDAKGELTEVVDFLQTPDRYLRLGAGLTRRSPCLSPSQTTGLRCRGFRIWSAGWS